MMLAIPASGVIGHGERHQDEQEEYGRDYNNFQELLAGAFQMHEEKGNQQGLGRRNNESDGSIVRPEVQFRDCVR